MRRLIQQRGSWKEPAKEQKADDAPVANEDKQFVKQVSSDDFIAQMIRDQVRPSAIGGRARIFPTRSFRLAVGWYGYR
eukprot:1193416-Prorocentrum_minimum.AAC.2